METMMGSTLIRMPYFISQAGIIPSINQLI